MKIGERFLILMIVMTIMIPAVLWEAYVSIVMWRWFITPEFGVQPPGLWSAAGILMMIGMVKARVGRKEENPDRWDRIGRFFSHVIMVPAFALFVGYIITLFM